MAKPPTKLRRFPITVVEMLVIVFIVSGLVAVLMPAVDASSRGTGEWPHPLLKLLYYRHPRLFVFGGPPLTTVLFAALLGIVRLFLPKSIRKYFVWSEPPSKPTKPIADSRPAVASSVLAFCGAAILIYIAWHVRTDRTHRQPVVTWEGPIADYVQQATACGLLFSAAAILLGAYALSWYHSRFNFLANIGMSLGILNLMLSLLFYVSVYED